MSKDLPVTVTDTTTPDTPGVTVNPTRFSIKTGASNTYSVSLNTQPTNTVTINVTPQSGVSVNPTSFSLSNQNQAQNVSVTAGSTMGSFMITHDVQADSSVRVPQRVYRRRGPVTVTEPTEPPVVTEDLVFNPKSLEVDEGEPSSYTVRLTTQPSSDVNVTISGHSGTDLTVSDTTLTFDSSNYGTAQSVRVSAGQDSGCSNDSITLAHSASGGGYDNKTGNLKVTIDDDETCPPPPCVNCRITNTSTQVTLSVIPSTVSEDAGQTDLMVKGKLNADPRGSATVVKLSITLGTASHSDFSSGTVDLTIPAGSTEATATLSFTPVYDSEDESSETVEVGGTTSGLTVNPATVTIENVIPPDTTPSVIVSKSEMTVYEGRSDNSDNYTVVLDAPPSANVTISIMAEGAEDKVTVMPDSLTFTPGNYDMEQTVTVQAVDDVDARDELVPLAHAAASTDAGYNGLDIDSVAVTVRDNDEPGVIVSPSVLWIEEELSVDADRYWVRLITRPTADVTIAISVEEEDGDNVEEVTTSPATLTFTPDNWDLLQEVMVSAGPDDDNLDDTATISHKATSTDDDYDEIDIGSVTVSVFDNDGDAGVAVSPSVLWIEEERPSDFDNYSVRLITRPTADVTIAISVEEEDGDNVEEVTTSPATLTFTPQNWGFVQEVTVSAGPDDDNLDDLAIITHTATSDDGVYDSARLEIASVRVMVFDNGTEGGVAISPTALWIAEELSGSSDYYTVRLRAEPSANVTIAISAGEEVTTSPTSLTFTPGNYSDAQTVTVSAGHDADTEDDRVDITHTATSTDSSYNGLDIDSVAVTVYDNDAMASVTISPTALWIEEEQSGFADIYTVKLRSEPSANVTIAITAGEEVTTSPARLTITPGNWRTEQTVMVSAGHDNDTEDDQVDITHTATSTDGNYNGLDIDSVAVTVYDNDAMVSVTISPTALWIEEELSGFGDIYTVKLRTEPSANVTIVISAGEEVTTSPARLTFTPGNWRTEQTVMVSAGHDADTEDDQVDITHTATSTDSGYNGLDIDSVAVTVYDNDATVDVTISPTALWIEEEVSGFADTYTVRLRTEPTCRCGHRHQRRRGGYRQSHTPDIHPGQLEGGADGDGERGPRR